MQQTNKGHFIMVKKWTCTFCSKSHDHLRLIYTLESHQLEKLKILLHWVSISAGPMAPASMLIQHRPPTLTLYLLHFQRLFSMLIMGYARLPKGLSDKKTVTRIAKVGFVIGCMPYGN